MSVDVYRPVAPVAVVGILLLVAAFVWLLSAEVFGVCVADLLLPLIMCLTDR